jgi:hypothetical protein
MQLHFNGGFKLVRQQQKAVVVPVQEEQHVEIPMTEPEVNPLPDPKTYMVLSTRKVDGVTVKTVSDRKTGNIYVITLP